MSQKSQSILTKGRCWLIVVCILWLEPAFGQMKTNKFVSCIDSNGTYWAGSVVVQHWPEFKESFLSATVVREWTTNGLFRFYEIGFATNGTVVWRKRDAEKE